MTNKEYLGQKYWVYGRDVSCFPILSYLHTPHFYRWFVTNLQRHRQQCCDVQLLVDEQKELMRNLLFPSTNMAAMIIIRLDLIRVKH